MKLNKTLRGLYPRCRQKFDRPIFLVGCSKSGTTIAASLMYLHPEINGGENIISKFGNVSDLNELTDVVIFGPFAHKMEKKVFWDKYFPINRVELRTGKELVLLENSLSFFKTFLFKNDLRKMQIGNRFFNKAPFNSFRINVLRELFPDAKIIAIERDGRDVVSSWGREANRWESFGGYNKAIPVFARKWNETIDHIEEYKNKLDVYTFKYEDLLKTPQQTLKSVFEFCELSYLQTIYDSIELTPQAGKWKARIPKEFHSMLSNLTSENLKRLGYKV